MKSTRYKNCFKKGKRQIKPTLYFTETEKDKIKDILQLGNYSLAEWIEELIRKKLK